MLLHASLQLSVEALTFFFHSRTLGQCTKCLTVRLTSVQFLDMQEWGFMRAVVMCSIVSSWQKWEQNVDLNCLVRFSVN